MNWTPLIIGNALQTCGILMHMNDVGYILNLLAAAGIVIIRVYGLSASNWRWLLIILPLNLVRPILYAVSAHGAQ